MNSESWHWNDEQELIHNSESDVVADIHIARHGPLIAAAPDLLEACRRLLMHRRTATDAAFEQDEAFARTAIARAEGKQ